MKQLIILLVNCLLYLQGTAQSSATLTTINNQTIALDSLAGKKCWS
ncbi:hypothetical protein [Paraflavitalea speifideaquila]|nr:hypothetical protein [Paraflavitalea speifideiaquila]